MDPAGQSITEGPTSLRSNRTKYACHDTPFRSATLTSVYPMRMGFKIPASCPEHSLALRHDSSQNDGVAQR